MPQLPFDLPRSLSSYAEQFDSEPDKAITRLQKQLDKRGPNAVGYFLLAWFFHLKGERDSAVDQAMLARIHAPGSPFLEKLTYYLSHPDLLEAWTPDHPPAGTGDRPRSGHGNGPVMDLDRLIEQLSNVETKRMAPDELHEDPAGTTDRKTADVDDIISDTLADIHARQGKTKLAITLYKRLLNRHDEREDYYRERIERLERKLEEE